MLKRLYIMTYVIGLILSISFVYNTASANDGDVMWTENGLGVCTQDDTQNTSVMIPDGCGGVIVSWYDGRDGVNSIYAQRLDANSNPKWGDGVLVCTEDSLRSYPHIVSDLNGGAIISWHDKRTDNQYDIYAQRLDASGNALWTDNGLAVCTEADDQKNPVIVSDDDGGAVMAWCDEREGEYHIYAQRIDEDGSPYWEENGVAICEAVNNNTLYPEIVKDGSGGAIVIWQDNRGFTKDIYAQRIDSNGNVVWEDDGVIICDAAGDQCKPKAVIDHNEGAIITWYDKRGGTYYHIYAQRVDKNGNMIWTGNGVAVCAADNTRFRPKIISDGSTGAILTWYDKRSGTDYDIYAQKINSDGEPVWTVDGVAICTTEYDQRYPVLVSDNNNGAIISWHDYRTDIDYDIYSQKINSDGEVQWEENGIAVCTETGHQYYPVLTSDGASGAICSWEDMRADSGDLYSQRIEGTRTWYLAEGATLGTFSEWVLVQNPNSEIAVCEVTFMKSDGTTVIDNILVPPTGRYTINVNENVPNDSVSTKITSTNGVGFIAERAMYWDAGDIEWSGGHCSIGSTKPDTTWYLAEGCTDYGFETWVLIQNPNDTAADCQVTFMTPDGSTEVLDVTVDPTSRYTIYANDVVPGNSISTEVISTNNVPIVVERAMYWVPGTIIPSYWEGVEDEWIGGHCCIGETEPNTVWYLAEGATLGTFDEWVLIQNPNKNPAECEITFMKPDGSTVTEDITVDATSRYTIHVNGYVPNESVSTKVLSTNGVGIIVERAMYWDSQTELDGYTDPLEWAGGHCSSGVNTATTKWYLAEGSTNGFDQYVLIQNPQDTEASCTVTFMKEDGNTVVQNVKVPATGRYTIYVNDAVPNESVSTSVESTNGVSVIAERAMYWNSDAVLGSQAGELEWVGGHCSKGVIY